MGGKHSKCEGSTEYDTQVVDTDGLSPVSAPPVSSAASTRAAQQPPALEPAAQQPLAAPIYPLAVMVDNFPSARPQTGLPD